MKQTALRPVPAQESSQALQSPECDPKEYRQSRSLLASIVANVLFLQSWVGVCYCPLLVFQPQLSASEASSLSRRASKLNGNTLLLVFGGAITVGAVSLSSVLPLYGMTDAALLVFLGVLNYVAYRDIFERRSRNFPETVAPAHVSGVAPASH
jgi:hypothetical protein